MLTSSRDNWERLVTAVVKRQQIWELCHQSSRTPSIRSTISSSDADGDDFSEPTLSNQLEPYSLHPSPRFSLINVPSDSQVSSSDCSWTFARVLFSAWYGVRKSKDNDLDIHVSSMLTSRAKLRRFSLQELQVATDKFSNKNIMWIGSFGKVYKGRLINGSLVSIRSLKDEWTPDGGELKFQTEVEISCMAVHRNLRRLLGFCITPTERLLVYSYMANGSVASCLRGRPQNVPPLDWKTRKHIALGSARGLCYLHDQCDRRIIHRDVKAGHIFLDEEYGAVVGDFTLAIQMDFQDMHVTTSVCSTTGYIAPEYFLGNVSEKTDVFGYGYVLLELITGLRVSDLSLLVNVNDMMLLDSVKGLLKEKKLKKIVDPDLHSNYVEEEVEQLIQVALLCTQSSAFGRPKMSEVVALLQGDGLAEMWDEWEKMEDVELV